MEAPLHVISKEIIKPSLETPNHLKKLKLSYLDQLVPPFYVPIVFFYQADESKGLTTSTNHAQVCRRLKQSLSRTLTSFYPFAGRMQDGSTVDCNDAGVEFIEVRVQAQLSDVAQGPQLEHLKRYLATDAPVGPSLLVVKVTFFDCGGIAIGVSVSHKIADCASIMAFVDAWATTCRGGGESSAQVFSFDLATHFPGRDFPDSDWPSIMLNDDKLVIRSFVFDKKKLTTLKQAVSSSSGSNVKDPTRVEAVSAFIWKIFMDVTKSKDSGLAKKDFAAYHAVNLRGRTSPPQLLENVSGNCFMTVLASAQDGEQLHDLVRKTRSLFRSIDHEYIARSQSGDCYLNYIIGVSTRVLKGEWEWCSFGSWTRFPVYEVDYGWGKPICFFTESLASFKNTTILLSSRSGDGIEALVTMPQDVIESLETQMELL